MLRHYTVNLNLASKISDQSGIRVFYLVTALHSSPNDFRLFSVLVRSISRWETDNLAIVITGPRNVDCTRQRRGWRRRRLGLAPQASYHVSREATIEATRRCNASRKKTMQSAGTRTTIPTKTSHHSSPVTRWLVCDSVRLVFSPTAHLWHTYTHTHTLSDNDNWLFEYEVIRRPPSIPYSFVCNIMLPIGKHEHNDYRWRRRWRQCRRGKPITERSTRVNISTSLLMCAWRQSMVFGHQIERTRMVPVASSIIAIFVCWLKQPNQSLQL